MKIPPPPLLSLLRSNTQGELLALVLLNPEAEYSISELAERTGANIAVVHREVGLLSEAGIVLERRVGRSRLVRANVEHELYQSLSRLILLTYGPRELLLTKLSPLPGISAAFIYGSWARRYAGELGPPPHDIDVAVVGAPSRTDVHRAIEAAEQTLGKEVNVTFISDIQWSENLSGFVQSLHRNSRVPLVENAGATR